MPEYLVFSRVKILFFVSLLFVAVKDRSLPNFKILIILFLNDTIYSVLNK